MSDIPPPAGEPSGIPTSGGGVPLASSIVPPQPPPSHSPTHPPMSDERQMALIIYILLFIAPFAFHFTGIIAVVLAYINRPSAPDWLKSHFTFQIHTFWLSLLYFFVAGILCFLLIGFLLLPLVLVWYIVRCAFGLGRLTRQEAYPTPHGWVI